MDIGLTLVVGVSLPQFVTKGDVPKKIKREWILAHVVNLVKQAIGPSFRANLKKYDRNGDFLQIGIVISVNRLNDDTGMRNNASLAVADAFRGLVLQSMSIPGIAYSINALGISTTAQYGGEL